jgi:hypothetical protein
VTLTVYTGGYVRNRLGVLGLAVLLVVDLVLVALAWGNTHPTGHPVSGQPEGVVDVLGDDPEESPSPEETSSATPGDAPTYVTAYAEGGMLLRAPVADAPCDPDGEVRVSISTDRGDSFLVTDLPPLSSVTELGVTGPDGAFVVGRDGECAPVGFRTEDQGQTWQETGPVAGRWAILAGRRRVSTPQDVVTPPCRPRSLSPVDSGVARVLCRDGRLLGTASAGAEWVVLGQLSSAVDVAYTSTAQAFGLSRADDCGAVVMSSADGGYSWDEARCAGAEAQGIAADGSTVVVLVDGEALVSTDGGETWETP